MADKDKTIDDLVTRAAVLVRKLDNTVAKMQQTLNGEGH